MECYNISIIPTTHVPEKHIFVCVNQRLLGDCCSKVSGEEIFKKLKKEVLKKGINVWVTKTGCMGFCNNVGATVAIYPDKKLFTEVKEEDVEKIVEAVSE